MGTEFVGLFDEWSDRYELTVTGEDEQYAEVFEHYDDILEAVASRAHGTVLEFGPGTGNLTEKLVRAGRKVYAVEPSAGMRVQFQKRALDAVLLEGDFLHFPAAYEPVDSIVSTYAFHHLTDVEKDEAVELYSRLLRYGGKIVFADTMFADEEARSSTELAAEKAGHTLLLNDLQTEYYTLLPAMKRIFENHGFTPSFSRLNRYVWLIEAVKNTERE